MPIQLTSPAFTEGQMIPKQYTCDAANVSPPLEWSGVPAGARSLALIADDPDAPAGTWTHWIVFNLPVGTSGLPEAVAATNKLENGALQGTTSFRKVGYGGPCPPGGTHRYYFKLYALDAPLSLTNSASAKDMQSAMQGHILASAQLMGRYGR
jgi:Raf kinase inhibitor-like YbhB/YbcL family protein